MAKHSPEPSGARHASPINFSMASPW